MPEIAPFRTKALNFSWACTFKLVGKNSNWEGMGSLVVNTNIKLLLIAVVCMLEWPIFIWKKNFFGILYRTPPYFRTIPKKITQWKFQVNWTSLSGLPKHLYSTNAGATTSYTSIREILVTLIKKLLFNGLIGCLVLLLMNFFFIIASNDHIVLVLVISINSQHGTT